MDQIEKCRNQKGFTLIEVIVTLAIFGIVMTAIFLFFHLGQIMTYKGTNQFTVQSDTRLAITQIQDNMRYASEAILVSSIPTSEEKATSVYSYIYLSDGKVYLSIYDESTGVRDETVAKGTYLMTDPLFSKVSDAQDSLYISLTSESATQAYTADATIKLPNLSIGAVIGSVQGDSTSQVLKFRLAYE